MMRRFVGLVSLAVVGLAPHALGQASQGTFPGDAPPPPAAPPPAAPPPATPPASAPPSPPTDAAPSVAAPAAPPVPATFSEPPPPPPRDDDTRPIRARRRFFVGGELGWNGLAGFGGIFSFHPIPQLAFDAGLGLSVNVPKLGVRARYNFLTGDWTPFLGAGMTYTNGTNGKTVEVTTNGKKTQLEVLPASFLQLAGGINYTGREGFVFMATTGYSIQLARSTTHYTGKLNDSDAFDTYNNVKKYYHGGVIVSVAFGYAF